MQQSEKEIWGIIRYGISIVLFLHLINAGEYIGALLVLPAIWLLIWLFGWVIKLLIALL